MNSQVQLNAPTQQTVGGTTYTFTGWSDGGAATHTVNAPGREHDVHRDLQRRHLHRHDVRVGGRRGRAVRVLAAG